jgi:hydrogenase maturation protein HypF
VTGTVRGVGFRPHVYRLATACGLVGGVYNDAQGVVIEAEGSFFRVEDFLTRLTREAPPLARVEELSVRDLPPAGGAAFLIGASRGSREVRAREPQDDGSPQ